VLIVFDEARVRDATRVYGKVDRIEQTGDDRIVVSIVPSTPLLDTERLRQGTR
jgi:tetrahydromethanopterin S-methyltransferase subunit B